MNDDTETGGASPEMREAEAPWANNPVLKELSNIINRANHVILDYPGSGMSKLAEANVEHTIRYVNKCMKVLKESTRTPSK